MRCRLWRFNGVAAQSALGVVSAALASACAIEPNATVEGPLLLVADSSAIPADFSGVVGAVRTSTGAIIVADRGAFALRVFRTQEPELMLGGEGDGPGEFRALTRLHLCPGDTVVAYDFAQARLHLFTERGFVRQVQLPPSLITGDFIGCLDAQTLVFSRIPDQVPGLGLHLVPSTMFSYSLSSGEVEWLATLRGTEMYFSERYQAFYERPFGLQTLIAAGPGGATFAENGRLQLSKVTSDGRTNAMFLQVAERRAVRRIDRERYLDERIAAEPDSGARLRIRGVLRETPWGERIPPIDRLVASTTGQFWIRKTPSAGEPTADWIVIDGGLTASATARLSRTLRVLHIDGDGVIGVEQSSTGEERLVQLTLSSPSASSSAGSP